MKTSERIFTLDAKAKLRFWFYEVDGDKWRGVAGLVDGAETASGWTTCVPKSKDTAEEQALFEAAAEEKKKLDRRYRRDPADIKDLYIEPMLAMKYDDLKSPLHFPCLAQPKLDGIRAIVSIKGATTREGQPIHTMDHILAQLAPVFEEYPLLVLDGELYNHDFKEDFNSLTSVIRKGFKVDKKLIKAGVSEETQREKFKDTQKHLIQYHVYDIADVAMGPTHERVDMIDDIFLVEFDCPSIRVVPTFEVHNQEELDRLLEQWLGEGYEGQMVRFMLSDYEHTRSWSLLKRKDWETKEFKLLAIEAGNGNWAGLAKRVVVELEDGRTNEGGIRGNMKKAKELLDNAADYVGWPVTMRFMKQRTPDGKLRAPVAIDFHPGGRKD